MIHKKFNFSDERISSENLTDGCHVVKVTPSGTKLLAYVVDGKITRYEAGEEAGNQPLVFSVSVTTDKGQIFGMGSGCFTCIDEGGDIGVVCFDVPCPPPSPEMVHPPFRDH